MIENKSKAKIVLLIGIFCCLALVSTILSLSPISLKASKQPLDVRSAANSVYGLDLNLTWGGTDNDRGYDITLDALGNIYITGYTESFGEGGRDAFIAKYDRTGVQQWNITWGGNNGDYGQGIVVDGSGNVYITGYTNSFSAGDWDAFIAKFNSIGIQQWNTTWGGSSPDYEYGRDIITDTLGNIYITGDNTEDAFIAKYNSAGIHQWNTTWGGELSDYGWAITVDASGNVYITGYTYNFGAGGRDAFIAKYDSAGNSLLNITWGSSSNDENGRDIVIDASGNIYITGYNESLTGDEAFIAKFDSVGNSLLNITCNTDWGRGIALDASGNIYITGTSNSVVFIAKYNSIGNLLLDLTGDWVGTGTRITLDDDGNIYITGYTESFSAGGQDAFIAKYLFIKYNGGIPITPMWMVFLMSLLYFGMPAGLIVLIIYLNKKRKSARL